jgi:hypothetical protein
MNQQNQNFDFQNMYMQDNFDEEDSFEENSERGPF